MSDATPVERTDNHDHAGRLPSIREWNEMPEGRV